jgi:DNA repair protein RadA
VSEAVGEMISEGELEEFRDPLLKLKGVTPEFAALLKEAGYYTIESIATEVPHFLFQRIGERMGFSLDKAEALIRDARSKLDIRIQSAKELYEEELKRRTIPTGSKALDEILGGGIRTQEITEVCGSYACGKTELVYTTAVLAPKALGGDILILDTEATLSVNRIRQIAKARELDPDEAISPIHLRRVPSSSDLIATLETAHKFIKERNIRYLAIDSFVSPFRREYPGRELLCPRQQKLNYAIGLLIKFARAYDMAVLVTNQVLATPIAQYTTTRPELLRPPIGGYVMAYGANNRIYLQETDKPNVSIATLIDSSYLPRQSRTIKITERGIEDAG